MQNVCTRVYCITFTLVPDFLCAAQLETPDADIARTVVMPQWREAISDDLQREYDARRAFVQMEPDTPIKPLIGADGLPTPCMASGAHAGRDSPVRELVMGTDLKMEANQIGQGSFGRVFPGMWHGNRVAIKVVASVSKSTRKLFEDEVEALQRLVHPGIVALYGWTQTDDRKVRHIHCSHHRTVVSNRETVLYCFAAFW